MIEIMNHSYLDESITFTIQYKKRKTVGIYIDIYGNIELRVPKQTSKEIIIEVVESKWNWIIRKSTESQERTKDHKEKIYEDGEMFLYLGNEYPIKIIEDANKDCVKFEENQLVIYGNNVDDESIRKALRRFYHQQSKRLVEKNIRNYQKDFKTKPRSIRIADNKSNWGSCDSNYKLTFNWRLSMAPAEVLEYVVVHELSHMTHLNHDRSFWRLVGKIMPHYKDKKDWLNANSWRMTI